MVQPSPRKQGKRGGRGGGGGGGKRTRSASTSSAPSISESTGASTSALADNAGARPNGGMRKRSKSFADNVDSDEGLNVHIKAKDDGNYKIVAPGMPYDELELHDHTHPKHKHHHHHHHHHDDEQKGWKKWFVGRRVLFPLAFLLGMAAVWTASQPEMFGGELTDVWPMLQNDMRDFLSNMTVLDSAKKAIFENRDFTVGDDLRRELGLEVNHPIILMPGVVTSGLESWSTDPAQRSWFRTRLWGTSTMIRAVLTDKERWVAAMGIDLETGLDPPGHKVRAAQGLDAASEFIQGYWVWQKVVQNLATLGYDTNTMDMAAYDWRVSYHNLEVRDAYLSRLKARIEVMRKTTGKKVVLATHSMGGSLMLYFLKWVEAEPDALGFGGGGGKDWVENNIEAWANIAGTLLGVPKAMTAFMSGEMRDTVEINPLGSYVLEKFFSRKERAELFRKWPGSSSMYMKGGNRIWGNETHAPDDPPYATDTYGKFFSFRKTDSTDESDLASHNTYNLTLDGTVPFVLEHTSPTYQRMFASNYSIGFETDPKQLKANARDHTKWSNPLEVELPKAPSMKIYCLYGHGKETERAYWYTEGDWEQGEGRSDAVGEEAFCESDDEECIRTPGDFPLNRQYFIDTEVSIKGAIPEVRSGVKFSDGDGTIATVGLGAMCVHGWKGKTRWNPHGVDVITQEFLHQPDNFDLRGGALTGDHVDILGSAPLNAAVLKIAAGRGDLVEHRIGSKILEYVKRMQWD